MTATPDDKPIYRLLTGKDDRAFCERVSEALAGGDLEGCGALSLTLWLGVAEKTQFSAMSPKCHA